MSNPLDTGLNVAVVHIASRLFPVGFDVSEQAPSTYEELKQHLDAGRRLIVYAGGSDRTIYGDPEVNWHFRAWHDWAHWRGAHDLTHVGECAATEMQVGHLRVLYGGNPTTRRWAAIIRAEIVGQAEFYRRHQRFPDDQRGFVEAYLHNAEAALRRPLW